MNGKDTFEELYKKYYSAVRSYFAKKAPADDVDDLTQQTFLKIWAFTLTESPIRSYKPFLFACAKNVLIDFYKKRANFISIEDLPAVFEIKGEGDFVSYAEMMSVLSCLSYEDRTVITMKSDGYTSREISKVIGISASAVRSRLQAIKNILKSKMK